VNSVQLGLALKYFRNKEVNKMALFSIQLQSRCNESLHHSTPFFAFIPRLPSPLSRAQFFTAAATFRLFIASTIYRCRGNRRILSQTNVKLLKEWHVKKILLSLLQKSKIFLDDLIIWKLFVVSFVVLLVIAIFAIYSSISICVYPTILSKKFKITSCN